MSYTTNKQEESLAKKIAKICSFSRSTYVVVRIRLALPRQRKSMFCDFCQLDGHELATNSVFVNASTKIKKENIRLTLSYFNQ